MREALYYARMEGGALRCVLCPHVCEIPPGGRGKCGVRENNAGMLVSRNYGMLTSIAADPVEKKPLRRFLPGTRTFSCGSFGCNLFCAHCQNWRIARGMPGAVPVEPREFVEMALEEGCPSVAFTYNEPTMFYEWMLECAKEAHCAGLKTILVTNGYISVRPLEELLPHIDAMNIDLKAFTEAGYERLGGKLEPVKHTIGQSADVCHVEIAMLLVPGILEDAGEVERATEWLAGTGVQALHLTRCFPAYRYSGPPTPLEFMREAQKRAGKYLEHVYLGNV